MKPFRALTLPILLLLAACSSQTGSETLPTTKPSIRGTITQVSPDEPRTVLVEEKPGEEAGNKASVRLTGETRVLRRSGEAVQRAAPEDLAMGQTVSVWFTGPVMESFPVQATAGTILIEEDIEEGS